MSAEEDAGPKEHEPTQKKLDDARARGEVVQSADLLAAAAYAGFLGAALFGGAAVVAFGGQLQAMLDRPEALAELLLADPAVRPLGLVGGALVPLLGFVIAPMGAVLAALFAQRALVVAPEKLQPRLSRIDPLAAARHKFGAEGLFEFAKGLVKLVLVSAVFAALFWAEADRVLGAQRLQPAQATADLLELLVSFLAIVTVVAALTGTGDYLWQRFRHFGRNRMSRQELLDEMRQSEGDPHVRMSRRRRAEEIAANRMMRDVASADVVIVNPTHVAVALRWKRGDRTPPVCVAKGADALAARIREAAAAAGVPIRQDAPTARALYATVEIGREIRPEHYRAVAAAIRFADAMRRRARERAGGGPTAP